MMSGNVIKVFLGGPNECTGYLREIQKLLRLQSQFARADFSIGSFYHDSSNARVLGSAYAPVQKRIDDGAITPKNCDLMIMLFDRTVGTECEMGNPPHRYPSWSAYEIDTFTDRAKQLDRSRRPELIILRNKVDRSLRVSEVEQDRLEDRIRAWKNETESLRKLDDYFRTLTNERVQEIDFAAQLEDSIADLLRTLIPELATRLHAAQAASTSSPPHKRRFPGYPYYGMEEFNVKDGDIFFGRSRETREILKRLEDPDLRLQFIQGPSGIGKSSLLKAGLLYQLTQDPIRERWSYFLFNPRDHGGQPFKAMLASARERERGSERGYRRPCDHS